MRQAKLGRDAGRGAIRRLDEQARQLERVVQGPSTEAIVAREFALSHALGGRSVFGWDPPPQSFGTSKPSTP